MQITETLIAAEKGVVSSELDGEVVLLDPDSEAIYLLNPVASKVWHLVVQSPKTVGNLRSVLTTEYEVDPDVCERDLMVLITALLQRRLVRVMSATPAASAES